MNAIGKKQFRGKLHTYTDRKKKNVGKCWFNQFDTMSIVSGNAEINSD